MLKCGPHLKTLEVCGCPAIPISSGNDWVQSTIDLNYGTHLRKTSDIILWAVESNLVEIWIRAGRLPCWRSFRSGRDLYPKPGRHVHQIGERIGFHLSHKIAAMKLHGNFADLEFIADLLVEQTSDH